MKRVLEKDISISKNNKLFSFRVFKYFYNESGKKLISVKKYSKDFSKYNLENINSESFIDFKEINNGDSLKYLIESGLGDSTYEITFVFNTNGSMYYENNSTDFGRIDVNPDMLILDKEDIHEFVSILKTDFEYNGSVNDNDIYLITIVYDNDDKSYNNCTVSLVFPDNSKKFITLNNGCIDTTVLESFDSDQIRTSIDNTSFTSYFDSYSDNFKCVDSKDKYDYIVIKGDYDVLLNIDSIINREIKSNTKMCIGSVFTLIIYYDSNIIVNTVNKYGIVIKNYIITGTSDNYKINCLKFKVIDR